MRKSYCSKCGIINGRLPQRYCHACHAAHMRATRPAYNQLSPVAKRKSIARAYANAYQRRGKLNPAPCETCGASKAEKHHDDYSRPLAVHWHCRRCHLSLHKAAA